jgi:hypothetical protein
VRHSGCLSLTALGAGFGLAARSLSWSPFSRKMAGAFGAWCWRSRSGRSRARLGRGCSVSPDAVFLDDPDARPLEEIVVPGLSAMI